jgi:hypothetical protein
LCVKEIEVARGSNLLCTCVLRVSIVSDFSIVFRN